MTEKSSDITVRLTNINGLAESLLIPERTCSLLWITDDVYERSNFELYNPMTGEITYDTSTAQSEPSMVWTNLPIERNHDKLPTEPFYYPNYTGLTPRHRYQYLMWLRDITQPTFLSFVFLYFYGLERHLVLGNYDVAMEEILVLLQHHDIKSYAYNDIALASAIRGKNIYDAVPDIEEHMRHPAWLRSHYKMTLTPALVLKYASPAGFTKMHYAKKYPDLFNAELQRCIDSLERKMGGPFFSKFKFSNYTTGHMINSSLNQIYEKFTMPIVLQDNAFEETIYSLLAGADTSVRLTLHPNKTILKPAEPPRNSAQKQKEYDELEAAMNKLKTMIKPSDPILADETQSMSDEQFEKSLEELGKIDKLKNEDAIQAIAAAHKLIDSGYRAPAAFEMLARSHIKKEDYKSAFNVLMQAQVDYGYNFSRQITGILKRFKSQLEV